MLLEEKGGNALPVAGGTDLMLHLKDGVKVPECLVDLRGIPALYQIDYSPEQGLKIGSLVSLRHLAESAPVKEHYPALAQAALQVASPQIQAMGTVGGNICQDCCCIYYNRSAESKHGLERCFKAGGDVCHTVRGSKKCWATFCGDLAPVLLTLEAKVIIADGTGERTMPLIDLFSGDGKQPIALGTGQILGQIVVPPPSPQDGSCYLKLRMRQTIDYPALGVAVHVTLDGGAPRATAGLTGVEQRPLFIEQTGRGGERFTDEDTEMLADQAYAKAHPLNNIREYTPKYRKEMVKVYIRSAMKQALQMAEQ